MEDGLVEHWRPAEVSAVLQLSVRMTHPQRLSHVIERNNLDAIEVIPREDVLHIAVPPVRHGRCILDRYALQLHGVGVPLTGPVAVGRGEVLGGGLAPEDAHFLGVSRHVAVAVAVWIAAAVVVMDVALGVERGEVLQEFEGDSQLTLVVSSSEVRHWVVLSTDRQNDRVETSGNFKV